MTVQDLAGTTAVVTGASRGFGRRGYQFPW